MTVLIFDESKLKNELAQLPKEARSAFAAACAQRIFPCYEKYSKVVNLKVVDSEAYAEALAYVWDAAKSGHVNEEIVRALLERCMAILPTEDDAWENGVPYAEDAAASVLYSLRSLSTGDPQESAWAARRVYEAVDNYVINAEEIDARSTGGEASVLEHHLVQNELKRQLRDLNDILAAVKTLVKFEEVIDAIRERAKSEAGSLFMVA